MNQVNQAQLRNIVRKPFQQLPVTKDIPRLVKHMQLIDSATGQASPADNFRSLLIRLHGIVYGDAKADDVRSAWDRCLTDEKANFPEVVGRFIQDELGGEAASKVVRALKGCNQSAIAPAVMEIKLALQQNVTKDVRENGWRVEIHAAPQRISVMHFKKETGILVPFDLVWQLVIQFDADALEIDTIQLLVVELSFGPAVPAERQAEIRRQLDRFLCPALRPAANGSASLALSAALSPRGRASAEAAAASRLDLLSLSRSAETRARWRDSCAGGPERRSRRLAKIAALAAKIAETLAGLKDFLQSQEGDSDGDGDGDGGGNNGAGGDSSSDMARLDALDSVLKRIAAYVTAAQQPRKDGAAAVVEPADQLLLAPLKHILADTTDVLEKITAGEFPVTPNFDVFQWTLRRAIAELELFFPAAGTAAAAAATTTTTAAAAAAAAAAASAVIADRQAQEAWDRAIGAQRVVCDFETFYQELCQPACASWSGAEVRSLQGVLAYLLNFPAANVVTPWRWHVLHQMFGPHHQLWSNLRLLALNAGFVGLLSKARAEELLQGAAGKRVLLLRLQCADPTALVFSCTDFTGVTGGCLHIVDAAAAATRQVLRERFLSAGFSLLPLRLNGALFASVTTSAAITLSQFAAANESAYAVAADQATLAATHRDLLQDVPATAAAAATQPPHPPLSARKSATVPHLPTIAEEEEPTPSLPPPPLSPTKTAAPPSTTTTTTARPTVAAIAAPGPAKQPSTTSLLPALISPRAHSASISGGTSSSSSSSSGGGSGAGAASTHGTGAAGGAASAAAKKTSASNVSPFVYGTISRAASRVVAPRETRSSATLRHIPHPSPAHVASIFADSAAALRASSPPPPEVAAADHLPPSELRKRPLPKNLDPTHLEAYLSADDFRSLLGATRDEFYRLPKWRQTDKKKAAGLF